MIIHAPRSRRSAVLAFAAALAAAVLSPARAADAPAAPTIYKNDDLSLIVETQELKRPRIERVVAGLGLRPDMTILDLGAGTGQQSYALASALKGTGRVDATDIDPQLVDYVNAQARKRGLGNLHANLVKGEGLDPFYEKDRYDLILMWEVYNYLTNRADFYRRLRASLKPGGRVVLVEAETMPSFARIFFRRDFKDWRGLVAAIKAEPPQSPFGLMLRAPLQPLFDRGLDAEDPALVRAVLYNMDRMLEGRMYKMVSDGAHFKPGLDFTPDERTQGEWMLHRLMLDRADSREFTRLEFQLVGMMALLNKLVVISHYRSFMTFAERAPYWSNEYETTWDQKFDVHVRDMEAAGFKLVDEKPLVPYQGVWTFVAAEPAPAAPAK